MNINEQEKEILEFWKQNNIFEKSLQKESPRGEYVFFEGPPTANGRPGIHHVLARAFKDVIPRFKTMVGFKVERKAGWDTHGLPVELEVEKKLGLKNKKEVEDYGIEKFNKQCKESVWMYKEEWEKLTERIGYWVDMKNPYITYDKNYIESLWWIIKQINEKNLLYKGYRVTPQCPRCGTALSSHEVAQGYKNIEEESVYIKFKLKGKDNEYILSWTTTPWTLPGNVALAVGENIDYVKIEDKNTKEIYILAEHLAKKVLDYSLNEESHFKCVEKIKGKDLIGLEYEPIFSKIIKEGDINFKNAFKIYGADFISTDDGVGVVHIAVMYGVDDYELGEKIGLPKIHTIDLDGTFNELVPKWKGKFVKNAEREIIEDLKERNILFKTELYSHDYPFCWRCSTPLIYYAKNSWYFAMSKLNEILLKNNNTVNWIPDHIKFGRFGEWLKEIKDWAISRERYWGTPIPIWECVECSEIKVIGSRNELGVDDDFDLHRPFVDELVFDCHCGGKMKRVPEVMDCWFDSGAMPFAQFHYPFENKELIELGKRYPADFICEAIDQTRGWFYTLLAVSVLLGKDVPYKNVICLGHILDKNGKKMSKSIGNVINPWEMIEKYGADALRWHLYTINQPGDVKRFDEVDLKNSGRIFITLSNVLNFYQMFRGKDENGPDKGENYLDIWILSKLNILIKEVTNDLEDYNIIFSARKIEEFIVDLSIWYIRLSRDRFKEDGKDKNQALFTTRFVLLELSKLMAPFAPFIAERVYKKVGGSLESVHLENWPKKGEINEEVLRKMEFTRKAVEIGLALRNDAAIKVRQPLAKIFFAEKEMVENIYIDIAKQELNIKEIVLGKENALDSTITPELKKEGLLREITREINKMRKDKGLSINNKDVVLNYFTQNKELINVFDEYVEEIKQACLCKEIMKVEEIDEKEILIEGEKIKILLNN